jgi:hypothetical protein
MSDLRKDLKGFTGYYIPPSMTDKRTVSPQRVNVKVLRDDGDTLLVEYEAGGIGHLTSEQFTPEYML